MAEAKKEGKVVHRFDAKEQAAQRIQDLLDGKVVAPNTFVEYMVDKLRVSRKEFDELGKGIQQARETLASMEKRILVVQGEHNKYLDDIRVWDRKLDENGEPVVSPSLPAPKLAENGESADGDLPDSAEA